MKVLEEHEVGEIARSYGAYTVKVESERRIYGYQPEGVNRRQAQGNRFPERGVKMAFFQEGFRVTVVGDDRGSGKGRRVQSFERLFQVFGR